MRPHLAIVIESIRHGDFSDRKLVQSATKEPDVQRTLARRLRDNANGACKVTREEEIVDQKRTDIRFLSVQSVKKAVAEVKIADKWSLRQLEDALRDQLVGQYLRHRDCKAGCLLLTYHGRMCYWLPSESRSRLRFQEIVAILRKKAMKIEVETSYDVRLSVFGIDLGDPTPGSKCTAHSS